MSKVVIIWPRMDCTFKEGPVPHADYDRRSMQGLPEIRQHWVRFLTRLEEFHFQRDDDVQIIYKPLWQVKPEDVPECDVVYVPHRLPETFAVPTAKRTFYYMQTVLPWLFTVSEQGWGARVKNEIYKRTDGRVFDTTSLLEHLQKQQKQGKSKFQQPRRREFNCKGYVLFVCQLPHDDTIKYFSQVEVLDALSRTSSLCKDANVPLIVKGHIANPGSQVALREFALAAGHTWFLDDYNIFDLMQNASCVASVNSGSMIEAMIMGKNVLTFGDSEYRPVVIDVSRVQTEALIDHLPKFVDRRDEMVDDWLSRWYDFCCNTADNEPFCKVPFLQ